jgi:hypothetical protein
MPSLEATTPVALFDTRMVRDGGDGLYQYDVTPDGSRFLINTAGGDANSAPVLNVVVNWNVEEKK